MADFDFGGDLSPPRCRTRVQGNGSGVGIVVVVGLAVVAGLGGIGWWAVSGRGQLVPVAVAEPVADKTAAPSARTQPPPRPLLDPTVARRQREQEAELERQREAAKAELEKQARKVELLRQLNDADAAARRQSETLVALIASLQAYIPEAEATVKQRRGIVAGLQVDVQLGRAFGSPRMAGNPNTREAALEAHLQQLRLEETALANAKARIAQAEADLKAARDRADAERRRIRRELDG